MQHSSQIRKQLEIMCIHSASHLYLCHHAFRVLTHLSSSVPMYTFRIQAYRSFLSPYSCLLSLQSSLRLHSYHLCVLTDFCVPVSSYCSYRLLCSSLIRKLLQMPVFLHHFAAPAVVYVIISSYCRYCCQYSRIISLPLLFSMFPSLLTAPTDLCSHLIYLSLLISVYPSHLCTHADYCVPVSSPCPTDFCSPVSFHRPYCFPMSPSHPTTPADFL